MKDKLLIFLKEWEETKKFSNLKSVVKAKTEDIIKFLNEISTHKGEKSWLVVPPNSKSKICLVAHIDRIFEHKHQKMKIEYKGKKEKKSWSSPHGIGGDDRCGVYGLIHVYRSLPAEKRPYILFTHEEESGLFGAKEAVKIFKEQLKDIDFFVEIDRKGKKDMVFYNDEPKSFEKHIGKHDFEKSWGTTSDIKVLGRKFHKKSVNVSAGYYNQHTKGEYIIVKHLLDSLEKIKNICIQNEPSPEPEWKYKEKKGWGGDWYFGYGGAGYGGWEGHRYGKPTPYIGKKKHTEWGWQPPRVEPSTPLWSKEKKEEKPLDTKYSRKLARKNPEEWTLEDERNWRILILAQQYKDKYPDLDNSKAVEFARKAIKLGRVGKATPKKEEEPGDEPIRTIRKEPKEEGGTRYGRYKERLRKLFKNDEEKRKETEEKKQFGGRTKEERDADEKENWNQWMLSSTKLPFHVWLRERHKRKE